MLRGKLNVIFSQIRQWLMLRYCPDYMKNMPDDKPGRFCSEAIISTGYWGQRRCVVESREVSGFRNAYITARWLALKAQWKRPAWLFACGIHYGVRAI